MQVSFQPHIGEMDDGRKVSLKQSYIRVDSQHVGYIGDHAGAHISFICPVPESLRAAVVDAVQAARGYKPATVEPPSCDLVESLATAGA